MNPLNSSFEPQLVDKTGASIGGLWSLLADDAPISEDSVLPFARALVELGSLNGRYAVRIMPGEDIRLLLPMIDRVSLVEVAFPGFRDGRGYSTARILRESGYTGHLRAVGDVLRDQLLPMLRCGFDQFAVKDHDPAGALRDAKDRFSVVYQGAADGRQPVWALRSLQGNIPAKTGQ